MNQSTSNKHQVLSHIVILLLCAVILFFSLLLDEEDGLLYLFGYKWPHRCPLYETVGIKCALCGLTRSFSSLAHGNWRQSIKFHALGPIIFAFTCFQIPYRIYGIIIHPRAINRRLIKINLSLAVAISILVLVNWFVYIGGLII
ncbi:MAG: DUF2752 domain-containing protein [Phycisphaerae bacterium]|nr:DUF2752 domain-containing protein [Phycisphaerae bacterium]NIR63425.1 DUF2752 domain-containing protein [candidate division Zixibacteria bacterium]NIP55561.1 DUF2752 domain-containing protein [Phycisphaerae bacterium]NIS54792.1 DUF2752 domain-containing protein [Phycisphaerae bacterium]NIU11891.1 DUF2752 domain-containing protein [Phycisphaerae bacterium]